MRIGIEIAHLIPAASGGVVPLIEGVFERLVAADPQHEFVVYRTMFGPPLLDPQAPNVRWVGLPVRDKWQHLQDALYREPVDVLFRAFPVVDDLAFPLCKQVVLIPDLQHTQHPEFFTPAMQVARRIAFGRVLRGAGAIGTISEFARHSILRSPETACGDIFLMPPALVFAPPGVADLESDHVARRLSSIGPYFYYPANLWKHKNHLRVIEAFERFRAETGRDISFVFTGHPEGWPDVAAKFAHLPLHHLGFVSRSAQHAIYRRAIATAFFSLYEGFGMPLLEAFAADCPVICSNRTSVPEVGGDAVLSCDPTDVSAIARLMDGITASPELRRKLVAAGRERLKLFSWERSAAALMAALTRVAAKHSPRPLPEAPLVSIVTPSFNQAKFLRRTIDSVLGQTSANIEYMVMDGGSEDGSVEILRSYGDRVRWISERDRGQTHAINKGFALAKGQIRGYLNSDDTLLPDAIEKVVSFFRRNPQCDLVYGDAHHIDAEDRVTGNYNTAPYFFSRLMLDCCVCQPAAFWRDGIAELVGPFDEDLDIVMDYDYWLRIARAGGRIEYLPELIANSRRYAATKTLSRREEVYREIFEICRRHGGYVSEGYFYGLWDHRLRERSSLIRHSLGNLPKLGSVLALLHHAWFHRKRALRRLVRKVWRMARLAKRRRAGIYASGVWPDSWAAPHALFATASVRREARLFFSGYPACDGTVAVLGDGRTLVEKRLTAGKRETIEFPAPGKGPVELRFSCSVIDTQRRKVSFCLDRTNLLEESDL